MMALVIYGSEVVVRGGINREGLGLVFHCFSGAAEERGCKENEIKYEREVNRWRRKEKKKKSKSSDMGKKKEKRKKDYFRVNYINSPYSLYYMSILSLNFQLY